MRSWHTYDNIISTVCTNFDTYLWTNAVPTDLENWCWLWSISDVKSGPSFSPLLLLVLSFPLLVTCEVSEIKTVSFSKNYRSKLRPPTLICKDPLIYNYGSSCYTRSSKESQISKIPRCRVINFGGRLPRHVLSCRWFHVLTFSSDLVHIICNMPMTLYSHRQIFVWLDV